MVNERSILDRAPPAPKTYLPGGRAAGESRRGCGSLYNETGTGFERVVAPNEGHGRGAQDLGGSVR